MASFASTILQLALALLMSVQTNTTATDAQRQQAVSVATQAIQLAQQALSETGSPQANPMATLPGSPPIIETSTSTPASLSTSTSAVTPTSTTAGVQGVSVCDLQNDPSAYLSKELRLSGTVAFVGSNYYSGNGNFYLENQDCKIQVSSWAPIEVAQCPPSNNRCSSFNPSTMSDYIGRFMTLSGQLSQQTGSSGTYYLFQGDPPASSVTSPTTPSPAASAMPPTPVTSQPNPLSPARR